MPPVLIALFLGLGLLVAGNAKDAARPLLHRHHKKVVRAGFLTTLSAPLWQVATRDVYGQSYCRATAFAFVGGGEQARAVIDGIDRGIDSSWSQDIEAQPAQHRKVVVRYLEPSSGRELACQEVFFNCTGNGRIDSTLSNAEPCRPAAGAQKGIDQSGSPRLVFRTPTRVMPGRFVTTGMGRSFGVGTVILMAEIHGEITEAWYCPRIEWEVPEEPGPQPTLTTRSSQESDCAPWVPGAQTERRFSRRVALPEGAWYVTARIYHGDTLLAQQTQKAVVGREGDDEQMFNPPEGER